MAEPLETIAGTVEKILFTNEENHYTVAQLVPEGRGRQEPVTIVGNLAALNVGETIRARGRWTRHRQFGRQFAVETFESVLPQTLVGIQKYLGSGLIKGVGPKFAERIVARFGDKTLEVIDRFSARLKEVDGIGPERARRIRDAWVQQKAVRDIMIFLRGHGIGAAHAARIYRRYGERALAVVRDNPYQLARDIAGIGFRTADAIAAQLGMATDAPQRLRAGLIHCLETAADQGHLALPRDELLESARELLHSPPAPTAAALQSLQLTGEIVADGDLIYLRGLHRAEEGVAARLQAIRTARQALPAIHLDKALAWVQQQTGVALAAAQHEAIRTALTAKVCVITGGPGVGKTTIVDSIVRILRAKRCTVLLAAPTGRAAKRLQEATGLPAQTIHRLLKYDPHRGEFAHDERRPLRAEAVIVDETSMLDIPLAHHLLRAIPTGATLVWVGDADQLPPVGPGNFLRDLIESGVVPVVRLTEIFRQARQSQIILNAHRINRGELPLADTGRDFFFLEQDNPEQVVATIKTLCAERIPRKFGCLPQVLTPMHKGPCGAENLNRELQAVLNPSGPSVSQFGRTYRVGDRLMQIRNNYDKDVFNGDLGWLRGLDLIEREAVVEFDDREVRYEFGDLDELVPAYAITVHKAQGNEYPAVVMPVVSQHYVLLQRNLLYTAVTRGKQVVVLVGSRKALALAVRNNRAAIRHGRLPHRLRHPTLPLT